MAARRALITGATGQDGAYLAQFLLERGYEVFAGYRRSSGPSTWRLEALGIAQDVRLVPLELLEMTNVLRCLDVVHPDEVYNLAAQSFVGVSFEQPLYTGDVTGMGTLRLLEAVRVLGQGLRFYQASTSEMFGNSRESPQSESTPFAPTSPYAVAKVFAHWSATTYRHAHGVHACCGIAFNHESPLRGMEFVTQKIALGLSRVRSGRQEHLSLGNLDARRDWGFAGEYVVAMWKSLQHPRSDDYVLASGESHSVREFVNLAARCLDWDLEWQGSSDQAVGVDRKSGRVIVKVDPALVRPSDVDHLLGDSRKARAVLGWSTQTSFEHLVAMMMEGAVRNGWRPEWATRK